MGSLVLFITATALVAVAYKLGKGDAGHDRRLAAQERLEAESERAYALWVWEQLEQEPDRLERWVLDRQALEEEWRA